jgi:hypothetical protein
MTVRMTLFGMSASSRLNVIGYDKDTDRAAGVNPPRESGHGQQAIKANALVFRHFRESSPG